MKILQLMPRFCYPPSDGGRIGIFNLTRELSRMGHEIHILSFADRGVRDEDVEAMRSFAEVTVVRRSTKRGPRAALRALAFGEPLFIARHMRRAYLRAAIAAAKGVDVIHADHSAMAPFALAARPSSGAVVGIRFHNVEHLIWERYAESRRSPIVGAILHREARLLRDREASMALDADVNFAISEPDAAILRAIAPGARVEVAPAGVDLEYWQPRDPAMPEPAAVIAAPWDWVHNLDGAAWFIREVLPRVRREIPSFELRLMGRKEEKLRHLLTDGVRILGFVPDVRPEFARAAMVVIPLKVGGGVRIKMLEAMALALPVVATTVGAEGIEAEPGVDFLLADDADSFAACVVRLVRDPALGRMIGDNGRALVIRKYAWRSSVARIERAYLAALERSRAQ